ncbi:MAG: TAXI family TRAP transporter solute-binding subunit [Kiloniellales bacterium]|nr:TAXI family TRAP transporter solute-binding subunit [Kiloniellales bacterium]
MTDRPSRRGGTHGADPLVGCASRALGPVLASRRAVVLGGLAGLAVGAAGLGAGQSAAAGLNFFRIGTGSTGGTYYPVGGVIAGAISNPPGSRPCERGGSCGVPGLIAVAQSTSGSVENAAAISVGRLESGFCQADVAYWASTGTGVYAGKGKLGNLSAIANLYPESLHLVVRLQSGIRSVADLRGRRVSLDQEGSGSHVDALLVLDAYGVAPGDMEVVQAPSQEAADMLREGELDAFFMVVGTPGPVIKELADQSLIALVPIEGPEAAALAERYPFFSQDAIASGTYFNVPYTPTLSVGAQWLVGADLPADKVYDITRALWHEKTRRLLDSGHPKGRLIRIETALKGLGVPLHPGAERYYREQGLLDGKTLNGGLEIE